MVSNWFVFENTRIPQFPHAECMRVRNNARHLDIRCSLDNCLDIQHVLMLQVCSALGRCKAIHAQQAQPPEHQEGLAS